MTPSIQVGGHRGGSRRASSTVDECDLDRVNTRRWSLSNTGYAVSRVDGRLTYLHRFILGVTNPRVQVDHRNRNKLDNRRANLRKGSDAENSQNATSLGRTSRFRGVSRVARNKSAPWVAQGGLAGRQYHLGYFVNEIDAAVAAEEWRLANMPFAEPDPALAEHMMCGKMAEHDKG